MTKIFVDESINEKFSYIFLGIVITRDDDFEADLKSNLRSADLIPGKDEYKSSALMARDPKLQDLRQNFVATICKDLNNKISGLIVPISERNRLGEYLVKHLPKILDQLDPENAKIDVFVDQGMPFFKNGDERVQYHWEQDSKMILGIQAADLVANFLSQWLMSKGLIESPKLIENPQYNAENGENNPIKDIEIWWIMFMNFRYFLFGETAQEGSAVKALGSSIYVIDGVSEEVSKAAAAVFGEVWVGCVD